MIKTNLKTLFGIIALVLGILGMNTQVFAQTFCRGGSAQISDVYGPCWENNTNIHSSDWHTARQERTNAVLEKLNLNAEQKKAWEQYQTTIATHLKTMQERRSINLSTMSTTDLIEKRQHFIREHGNLMTQNLEALKTFYATLTPEQQQIFDAEIGLGKGYHHSYGNRQRHGRGSYLCDGAY